MATVTNATPPIAATPSKRLTRRQRRLAIRATQYLAIVVVVAALAAIGDWNNFASQYLNVGVAKALFVPMVTTGLVNTLLYTISSLVLTLILGLIVALMRLSDARLYRVIAVGYVELFRGLPMLLVLFLVVYGIPIIFGHVGVLSNFFVQAVVGLSIITSAYMSETIRAGIQAVPRGQREAARSLGMSTFKTMVFVVLPQALRIIIPPMTTQVISLVKDSSLVYVLGVTTGQYELTKMAQVATSGGIIDIPSGPTPLLMAGCFYLLITLPLSRGVHLIEQRTATFRSA